MTWQGFSGSLNARFTSSLAKRRNELLRRPPYALSRPESSERVVGRLATSQGTSQKHSNRDRTRPLTHSLPQQTPTIECHDLAGILRAAAAENAALRRVTDFGMLALLLKPARSFLSYACSELVVSFVCARITDLRDMNISHGEKRLGRSRS